MILRRFVAHLVAHRALAARALLVAAAIGSWLDASPAAAQQSAALPKVPPELEKIRTALDKYRDPMAAVHDGYFSTVGCISFPRAGGAGEVAYKTAGGMGVHFLNMGLVGPELDPLRPQVLLYEPEGDRLELAGAEWFVPLSTGVTQRPELYGQPFDGPMAGHHPVMPATLTHYDLHVWLWKENPAGLFNATNPDLKCPEGAAYSFTDSVPKIVQDQ